MESGQGDLGASASADQALAVPVEPEDGLAPSGFDPSRWATFYEERGRTYAEDAFDCLGKSKPYKEFVRHREDVAYAAHCLTIAAALRKLSERDGATPPEQMTPGPDGWTDWVHPNRGYRTICCDCSSVHEWQYAIVPNNGKTTKFNDGEDENAVVVMRARRRGSKPTNIEAVARALHDAAFTYAHALPAWDELPQDTRDWFLKRACRLAPASGAEARQRTDPAEGHGAKHRRAATKWHRPNTKGVPQ